MAQEMRDLVRIANTDIRGEKSVLYGLGRIYGVSLNFSNAVCTVLGMDKKTKVGMLTPDQIKKIEETIEHPQNHNIPAWLYNRKFDPEEGTDKHIVGPKLKLRKEFDVRRMKKIKSYKGVRHMHGLPVRGQRTKGNFRKGKSVGVVKKKK